MKRNPIDHLDDFRNSSAGLGYFRHGFHHLAQRFIAIVHLGVHRVHEAGGGAGLVGALALRAREATCSAAVEVPSIAAWYTVSKPARRSARDLSRSISNDIGPYSPLGKYAGGDLDWSVVNSMFKPFHAACND